MQPKEFRRQGRGQPLAHPWVVEAALVAEHMGGVAREINEHDGVLGPLGQRKRYRRADDGDADASFDRPTHGDHGFLAECPN